MRISHCRECDVCWPYGETNNGCCPICGSGTIRVQRDPSPDYGPLLMLAQVEQSYREKLDKFDAYVAEQEKK